MEGAEACKRIGVSARIENHPDLNRGERPVFLRSKLDGDTALWRGIARQEVFLACIDQAHRLAQAGCNGGCQRLQQSFLAAKSSTDEYRLDVNLPLRHGKRPGNRRAYHKQSLRAGPDYQVLVGRTGRDSD